MLRVVGFIASSHGTHRADIYSFLLIPDRHVNSTEWHCGILGTRLLFIIEMILGQNVWTKLEE